MNFKSGEVVLVRFPFSDIASNKQRPALVLSHIGERRTLSLTIVAMITSRIDSPKLRGDVVLKDWEAAGLLHASKVRFAKIASLDDSLIRKPLGKLSRLDLEACRRAFHEIYRDWK